MAAEAQFTVDVTVPMDYGQFYLRTGVDEMSNLDAAPLVDVALAGDGIAQDGPTVVVVCREDFVAEMPVRVELWSGQPASDPTRWLDAFEVSLEVSGAGLRYDSCTMGGAELPVPPGKYRTRILGTGPTDELGMRWLLQLWPETTPSQPVRLHTGAGAPTIASRSATAPSSSVASAIPPVQVELPIRLQIDPAFELSWSALSYDELHRVQVTSVQWQVRSDPRRSVAVIVINNCPELPVDGRLRRVEQHAGIAMRASRMAGGGHCLEFALDGQCVRIEGPTANVVGVWADRLHVQPTTLPQLRPLQWVPHGYRANGASRTTTPGGDHDAWELQSTDHPTHVDIGVTVLPTKELWETDSFDRSTVTAYTSERTPGVQGDFYQDTVWTQRSIRIVGPLAAVANCYEDAPTVSDGARHAATEVLAAVDLS